MEKDFEGVFVFVCIRIFFINPLIINNIKIIAILFKNNNTVDTIAFLKMNKIFKCVDIEYI